MNVLDRGPSSLGSREIAIKASADLPEPVLLAAIGPLMTATFLQFWVSAEDLFGGWTLQRLQNLGD